MGGEGARSGDAGGWMSLDDWTRSLGVGNQNEKVRGKDVGRKDDWGAGIEKKKQALNGGRTVEEQWHRWSIGRSRWRGSRLAAAATGGRYQT
ncbi:DUF3274 domain-containing protein, partial [Burkholderia pseudomallei]|uniref:DUF3274 domain-containing protein n=1 Tax=Burkholderia pseudomallei TaxID=28450 RepID=UPI0021F71AD0